MFPIHSWYHQYPFYKLNVFIIPQPLIERLNQGWGLVQGGGRRSYENHRLPHSLLLQIRRSISTAALVMRVPGPNIASQHLLFSPPSFSPLPRRKLWSQVGMIPPATTTILSSSSSPSSSSEPPSSSSFSSSSWACSSTPEIEINVRPPKMIPL